MGMRGHTAQLRRCIVNRGVSLAAKCSPLDQAEESEHRAVEELEAYFEARDTGTRNLQSP